MIAPSPENQDPKGSMFYGASPIMFELAKKLRNNVTSTEMILWGRLKQYFPELKFRRQHPISIYIVDFYCHSTKLIIELDGNIHNLPDVKNNDEIRQKDLENLGLKIIRFTNKEITNNLEQVLQTIEKNIKSS
jgi:imidazole glycerol-phosphate synthase subunit HisF